MKHLLFSLLLIILCYKAIAQSPKARWVPAFGVEANHGITSLDKAFSSKTTSSYYNLQFRSHFDFVLGLFRVQEERKLFATGLLAGWGELYGSDHKYSMSSVPAFVLARYRLAQIGIATLTADGKLGARYFYSNRETQLNNTFLPEYGAGFSAVFALGKNNIPLSLSVQYLQTGNFQFISTGISAIPLPFK